MRAGPLRHVATFQEQTKSRDRLGAVTYDVWNEKFKRRFRYATSTGTEVDAARVLTPEMTHLLVCRYIDTDLKLLLTYRVSHIARQFEILAAIDPTGRKRETHLKVRELIADNV